VAGYNARDYEEGGLHRDRGNANFHRGRKKAFYLVQETIVPQEKSAKGARPVTSDIRSERKEVEEIRS